MRIRSNEKRERKWDSLKEATGKSTTSGALDVAANYYLRMRGGTTAVPHGKLDELMQRADEQGSVNAEEIAEVLDVDELPVSASTTWSVGET
jgi:hypothetical protein